MTLHVVSLPHTETTSEFVTCAYTQKLVKFGKMMTDFGEDVVIYSGEENEAICREHVPVFSREERIARFGDHSQDSLWGQVTWDANDDAWVRMNARAVAEIRKRADPHDLVLLIAGLSQKPIADALPELTNCEWGVGYEGIFSWFCAFESYAWRHYMYGKMAVDQERAGGAFNGRWFDTVIPNFFDPGDFHEPTAEKGDYLLFVGRLIERKGPHVAAQVAEAAGMRLVVAGPGGVQDGNRVVGNGCILEGDHVEYVGPVDTHERANLMRDAVALLAPTAYIEPFGGVAVEAMLAGAPVITSDWGAFSETVVEGVSGYRFRTLGDGKAAVEAVAALDPFAIRDYALERYSLAAVAPLYHRWFQQLRSLHGDGWYDRSALPAVVGAHAS